MARARLLALGLWPEASPPPERKAIQPFNEWLQERFPAPAPPKPKPTLAELPEAARERQRLYMREYRAKNLDRIKARARELNARKSKAQRERIAARERARYARKVRT